MNRKHGQVVRRDSFWEHEPRGGMYAIWVESVLTSEEMECGGPVPRCWPAVAGSQHRHSP